MTTRSRIPVNQEELRPIQLTPTRSAQFYFPDGNVIFLVRIFHRGAHEQNISSGLLIPYTLQLNVTLYRVYKYPVQQASIVFASMFAMGNEGTTEGTADHNPIVLSYVPVDEFEAFLTLLFPTYWHVDFHRFLVQILTFEWLLRVTSHATLPTPATMDGNQWMTSYAACERWDAQAAKDVVKKNLAVSPPAVRVAAGLRFPDLKSFISPAALVLTAPDCKLEFLHLLPPGVLAQLVRTREEMARANLSLDDYRTHGVRNKFRDYCLQESA
jgi:hypothetical protein